MTEYPFPTSISVDDAVTRICALTCTLEIGSENVPLAQALHRVLATDVLAPIDVPGWPNSAMDGFALRAADVPASGEIGLRLVATRLAGDVRTLQLQPGECARITTGAPLPDGADTVVMKENVRISDAAVYVRSGVQPGAHVRCTGEDYKRGSLALKAGTRLGAAHIGVLASLGLTQVPTGRPPRVALLTTGDEVVEPGETLQRGFVYNSNRHGLASLIRQAGAELVLQQHRRDDVAALSQALTDSAAVADLVISCGGVSAGEADHMPALMQQLGTVDFWKVRMKPGMPVLFGTIGSSLVFGLPGNPVSGMVSFLLLVRPAIDRLLGVENAPRAVWYARLAGGLLKSHSRAEFQRGSVLSRNDGSLWVTAFSQQGSGVLRSVAEANCMIVLAEQVRDLPAGSVVEILPLPGMF